MSFSDVIGSDHHFHSRVTVQFNYFRPLPEGERERKVGSNLLGERANIIRHSGIVAQPFLHQFDDTSDVTWDEFRSMAREIERQQFCADINLLDRLAEFNEGSRSGRPLQQQFSLVSGMVEFICGEEQALDIEKRGEEVPSVNEALKDRVPFPKVRDFVGFWYRELSHAPLIGMSMSVLPLAKAHKGLRAELS